jgi:hypothetical protein
MERPKLRAEALIYNEVKKELLVQCDLEESFYRLQAEVLNLESLQHIPLKGNY